MDQFQTSEGKFLFIVYNLYKSNRIGIQQKNDLKGISFSDKDMLIAKDARIQQVISEVDQGTNVGRIERALEEIMSEEHSPRDLDDTLSHTYKQKRPQLFKFNKSNFSKYVDFKMKASDNLETYSSNKNLEYRKRLYSTAADSC